MNLDVKQIKDDIKWKIYCKLQDVKEWIIRNRDMIVTIAPVALGCMTVVVKTVGKRSNLHKTENLKNLYCYDRSLVHYWRLKRQLSNREWVDIDRRRRRGERLSDILSEMNVLK